MVLKAGISGFGMGTMTSCTGSSQRTNAMDLAGWIDDFLGWERRHNVLSWYIRSSIPSGAPFIGRASDIVGLYRGPAEPSRRLSEVAGPASPWHDGRERGKSMNRRQLPSSGCRARGARP